MRKANTRADYYARAIGQLGRTLRAIERFEQSAPHGTYGRGRIEAATDSVRAAMSSVGAANKAAENAERGVRI